MKLLRISVIIGIILGLLLAVVPAFAADQGNDQNFAQDRILVKFRVTDEPGKQEILRRHGDTVEGDIAKIGVSVVRIPRGKTQEKLLAYRGEKGVQFTEPDYIAWAIGMPDDPNFGSQWGMTKIQAPQAWDITTGQSDIKIAILDTGVDQNHEDLAAKIAVNKNFTDSGTADDLFGHGTHVAGIAAAATNNGIGVAGVGYNSSIMNVKVLGDNGGGYDSWIASGIIWAADNGAKVISMSIGSGSASSTVENAVNYAWSKGVVIVAAAGNSGSSSPSYPAYYTNVIAVGATDQNDVKASFSTYGSWVDVAAPGVDIFSTTPNHDNYLQQQGYFGYNYGSLSGTSMATPYVAGLAGLVWASSYGIDNVSVRNRIQSTCDPVSGTGTYWQYGRINAYQAIVPATPQSPTVSIVSPLNGATISGTVTVTASASDDMGVAGVRFLLDGASLGTEVSSAPYSISWNSTGTTDGSHTLRAIARDTSGNEATSSIGVIVANNTTGSILNIQKASSTTTGASSLSATLPLKVTAGNLIVVSVSGWQAPATLTVSDSLGNTYSAIGAMKKGADNIFCSLYYARNIIGGTDTVTVKASTSAQLSMTAAEFAGVDTASPLGAFSSAAGTGATPSSGNMAPSMSGVLVIGAGTHNNNTVTTAGSGFTMVAVATEDCDTHQPLATEFKVLGNTNLTAATLSLAASEDWVQVGALFKPAIPATPDTTAPSIPSGLTATAVSTSQVNLSWTASTDDVGVAGYKVFRNGTQIATTSTTSYSDNNLQASTTYTYTVAAYDAAGNTSTQSSQVSATTKALDTTAPSVPSGLTATVISTSQVNLSWTASTDDVGVAGYKVFRNGTQIATTSTTSYSDNNLQASTTYTYTVAAYDAAGNTSAQSPKVSVITKASDFSISISPSSRTVNAGRSTTYTVKLTALNGYNLPVKLTISGLPSGATYTFSKNPLTPTSSGAISTLTIYTKSGQRGTYILTITGTGTDINVTTHSAAVTLNIR